MMAAPSGKWWRGRSGFGLYELLHSWWRHRVSFVVSLCITVLSLGLYYVVFLQESTSPLAEFFQRFELDSLDTRFRYLPRHFAHPDSRIVIVDIDQRSEEVLGRWPFSRTNFAKMLDVLHRDGARVAAFDVTFAKPDQSAAPVLALQAELERRRSRGQPADVQVEQMVRDLAAQYDADKQFAASIRRFGPVILGSFFFYTQADLRGVDDAMLDAYADQLAFFAFPQVIGTRPGFQKQDRIELLREYAATGLLPKGAEANIEVLTGALGGDESWTGFFNMPPDADGVVRRATLVLPYGRSKSFADWDLYASLDVMAARAFLGVKSDQTVLTYGAVGVRSIELGSAASIHPDGRGQIMINYQGPTGTFPHYSLADVVAGAVPSHAFRNKLVLIGASATGIGDLRATPYGGTDYPGVEIHANIIDNILNQRFLKRGARQALADLLLILFFGIGVGISLALVSPRWMWFGLGLLLPLIAVDYGAFLRGWWLNFTVPALALTTNVLLVSLYRALIEEQEKRRVRSAFGQYLSPEVIRRLLLNPGLVEPRKTDITVMFSDIRGFTTISEKLDAQELALFLNQYLSDMTRIVFEHQGTLDKYIGDAVMAFWGAPFEEARHAENACNAALAMMARVREMQPAWEREGRPRLDIGIGVNTGSASVGNMGSSLRYGYTALGDAVNLSSRLEGLNKEYGTHILVNETTVAAAQDGDFIFRELDLIRVKGKLQPVTIYELAGRRSAQTPEMRALFQKFAEGLALYRTRRWADAQRVFQGVLDDQPGDGPSRLYWKRCQEYLFDEPPASWDGVFTMTHK